MATWSTLHIFGYGETQLIGTDFNKKVPSAELTTLAAVVDNVYSFKPEDNTANNVILRLLGTCNNKTIIWLSGLF
jgi:hypothetical protein